MFFVLEGKLKAAVSANLYLTCIEKNTYSQAYRRCVERLGKIILIGEKW
jgi:hypothetical protein